ncbi:MAG: family 78 glycoside hydrolase catalytic domain [Bryobacteraceae bacterium]|nr:family 78 glycoside hydrolase catalytic domain [Bryobacteraceae bacterium]
MLRLCPLLLVFAALRIQAAPAFKPVDLRCEYRRNPLGIDVEQPRLSWRLGAVTPGGRGLMQSAWRILVATSPTLLEPGKADLWDSGRQAGSRTIQIVYQGKALSSGMQVYWKAASFDASGAAAWSDPAEWSMGILRPAEWGAQWIGREEDALYRHPDSPSKQLESAQWITVEKSFAASLSAPADVVRARAVFAAQGKFELFVNGARAGLITFAAMPHVFEIGPFLKAGDNRLEVMNKSGDLRPGKLIGSVRVETASGSLSASMVTGGSRPAPAGTLWRERGYGEERVLPARYLRKEFDVVKPVKRAMAYVAGLGLYEMYVNGRRVGDAVLQPNLSEYDKRVYYNTHDITPLVRSGSNAVGVVLGNGRYWAPRHLVPAPMRSYGTPRLIARIEIEHADGTKSNIVTNGSWRLTTNGPIRANNEFDGEEHDARLAMPGWAEPGFGAAGWEPAQVVIGPTGILAAQMAEPLRVTETLKPVRRTEPRPGVWVFDMGQNMVGWARLRVSAPRGARIRLRFAETLDSQGLLYVDNLRSARATDEYIARGGGEEIWEPSFTYHGFRFVEVTGYPGEPPMDAIEGRVVHDAMERAGGWESSNSLLTQLHKNIYWGVRGNYRSIPTDCPQRDERQGWLGDRSVVSRGETYLFDVSAFYTKWVQDIEDAQKADGSVPVVAPAYWPYYNEEVTWASTFLLVPSVLHDLYGDTRVIEKHYPAMKRWIDHMRGYIKDGLMPRDSYADWCVPPEKPELIHSQDPTRTTEGRFLATAYFIRMLGLMERYARIARQETDAREFASLAASMTAAFNKYYFNAQTGLYANGTQTSSILPLAFGIAAAKDRKTLFDNLVRKIEVESNGHVGVGLIGAQWLMRTLSDNGRPDAAYRIATQKTYPGWGYMIEKGATTIWELWNGDTADPAMNSGNHVMQIGDLNLWLYETLAGIRPDPAHPAFSKFTLKPTPVEGLDWVKAWRKTPHGEIRVHWRKSGGKFELDAAVPPNTVATILLPAPLATVPPGLRALPPQEGRAAYQAVSGEYQLAVSTSGRPAAPAAPGRPAR